jgi:copper(I)-binding protein
MNVKPFLAAAILGAVLVADASAQVAVRNAWVRATVPQQTATGAFMQLKAEQDTRLVSVSSSAAPVVEVHEMALQDNVMRMRPVQAVELPAGKAVDLKPGGHHVMLMGLKQPVKAGETVPLTLTFEDRGGRRQSVGVNAVVRPLGTAEARPAGRDEHKH